LRTALLTGNPLYPSGPDEWVPLAVLDKAGLTELVWFPWAVVMRFFDYGGWAKSPGCLVLLLGVLGLSIGGRRARWFGAYSIAACLYFFFFRRSALEMLPFFVPMMGVAAAGAVRLSAAAASMEPIGRDRQGVASGLGQAFSRAARDASVIAYNAGRGLLARHMTSLLAAVFVFGLAVDAVSVYPRLRVVFGLETREDYLDRTVEHDAAFRWLNEHAAEGVVLAIDPRSYFIKGRSYRNYEAVKCLRGPLPLEQLDWLRERGITHVLVSWKLLEEGHTPFDGDLKAVLTRWLRNGKYFKQEHVFETVIRDQVDRVEIYRVSYGEARGHSLALTTGVSTEGT
jgi:hypothetical protein